MKAELVGFAAEVAPQCAMPEVGFNEEGIMKHVQSYFNEQRRYRRHKSDCKVTIFVFSLFLECIACTCSTAMPWALCCALEKCHFVATSE